MARILGINVITLIALVAIAVYFAYKPLPETLAGREFMQWSEPVMRLLCYYPNKILSFFGFYRLRIYWTRLFIGSSAYAMNAYSSFVSSEHKSVQSVQAKDMLINDVLVRVYTPVHRLNNGAIFYIHGGGYVLFNVYVFDRLMSQISIETGMTVLSVNYRLAPEHIFPAAVKDCEQAFLGLMTHYHTELDIDPSKVIIAGDSAGGTLATVLSRKFKDDPRLLYPIKAQVLIYPLTQFVDLQTPSYQYAKAYTEGTSLLDADSITLWLLSYIGVDPAHAPYVVNNSHWQLANFRERVTDYLPYLDHNKLPFDKSSSFYQKNFFGNANPPTLPDDVIKAAENVFFDPDFSPLLSDAGSLAGSPETLILTCEFDVLRDDGYFYFRRLQDEGVKAKWIHYERGFHGMIYFFANIDLAQKALKDIAHFVEHSLLNA